MVGRLTRAFAMVAICAISASAAAAEFETLFIEQTIPFESEDGVDPGTLKCRLGADLSVRVVAYARRHRITVQRSDSALTDEDDYVAIMISNVVNDRGFATFHRKSTTVFVELYIGGQSVAWTTLARRSNGGFMGPLKGSCSVLQRTIKVLGSDIASWLASIRTK
ncbi:unnamed protein product [marine sediment metagenome]|uniref:Uncharacterized protein n=1 Tax=marine sediment metagenome TaxID=412755 RepID=X1DGK2_9ZZZZ